MPPNKPPRPQQPSATAICWVSLVLWARMLGWAQLNASASMWLWLSCVQCTDWLTGRVCCKVQCGFCVVLLELHRDDGKRWIISMGAPSCCLHHYINPTVIITVVRHHFYHHFSYHLPAPPPSIITSPDASPVSTTPPPP